MTKNLSIYIDFLRIVAAATVFVGHANSLEGDIFGKFGWRAPEAVAVFFVLSGFVISYVATGAERCARRYAVARIARIYSVAVPAIIVTLMLDAIGRAAAPQLYNLHSYYNTDTGFIDILRCLIFTNEVWGAHSFVGSNEPYWSLGYEVLYYWVFGIAVFAPPQYRVVATVAALVAIGPNVVAYFPLWLIGVGCHRILLLTKGSEAKSSPVILIGAVVWGASFILCFVMMHLKPHPLFDMYLPVRFDAKYLHSWLYFHVLGALIAMNILGMGIVADRLRDLPKPIERVVRWASGGTFTLYLIHQPLILFMTAVMPGDPVSFTRRGIIVIAALALSYLFAELGERRKALWRRWASYLLSA